MKRIFSFLICFLLLISILSACGGDSSNKKSDVNADSVITKNDVNFLENGEAVYNIIRPVESTELDETTPAAMVFKQAKAILGVNLKNQADDIDGTDNYEILIGATNRPESKQALEYIESQGNGRYNDWIVCTIGKKIVINAYNADGLQEAANYFITNFLKAEGVKGGIEYVKLAEGDFVDILVNNVNLKDFKVVRPRFNFSYLAQVELDKIVDTSISKTGFDLTVVHDNTEASEYEIIVGNAARDGVEAIADHDAYSIKVSGKKIYINGGSIHSTAVAVSEFAKMLESGNVTDANSTSGSYTETIKNYGDDTFKYAWGDDFDGDTLDTSKWWQMNESQKSSAGQHGKKSVRNTDPNYVYVRDGKFHICATYDDNYWYGGMIRTQNIMMYRYGYAEISAVVPHGPSFWVAFWASIATNDPAMSNTDPSIPMWMRPEIDIMEMFGNSASYAANGHRWPTSTGEAMGYAHTSLDSSHGQSKKYTHPDAGGRLTDDFHTYGFLWDDTQIAFTCDGELFFKYDTTTKPEDQECFNHEMYLILSMALGYASQSADVATATEDEWNNTNKFIIDYCNIYQQNDGKSYICYLK